jgi:hypothetical protein
MPLSFVPNMPMDHRTSEGDTVVLTEDNLRVNMSFGHKADP